MEHKRYLRALLLASFIGMAFAAAVNYAVDPYDLFGSTRVANFNQVKPYAGDRTKVVKPYGVLRAQPQVLIAGNSRPEMGIDPRSACWRDEDGAVYNLAMPGASVYRQMRYAQHALAQGTVKRVFMGLDFLDFVFVASRLSPHAPLWPNKDLELDGRLIVDREGRPNGTYQRQRLLDYATGLFSLQGLLDSLRTALTQAWPHNRTRRADGFNPAQDYVPIIRSEGQFVLFAQKIREIVHSFAREGLSLNVPGQDSSTAWESLSRFLTQSKTQNVEVTLFINPYHAEYFTAIDVAGAWPLFEAWKRKVVAVVERQGDVPLWDFNMINAYTQELPPPPGNTRHTLRWFWEPAHYRAELGELMLARMLARNCATQPVGDFGVLFNGENVDRELAKLREDLDAFKKANPAVVERIRKALPVEP